MRGASFAVVTAACVAGVVACVLGATACASRRGETAAAAPPGVARFPHEAEPHATLPCSACHPTEKVLAGQPARPGTNDHAPCDDGTCHQALFLEEPGPFCRLCHADVVAWQAGATTASAYPPEEGPRALASEFNHRLHLDRARMDKTSGFHVACGDCHHRPDQATDHELPGHGACLRCHDATRERPARPILSECGRCHVDRPGAPPRARRLIRGDLRFRHAAHELDRSGRAIACVTCHPAIAQKTKTGKLEPPATSVCVACHDDSARTPPHAAMSQCETCHARRVGGLESFVAPRSHLPARDRPDDHTMAFRKDHAADAERDAARCAKCHSAMSGSGRDNCEECHASMEPNDHWGSWAELDHGAEAATDAERCSTCHGSDFCVACHQIAPRSHHRIDWCGVTHAIYANDNPRSCQTCHSVDTCQTCHATGAACGPF
jgi:hypothetical protein